MLDSMFSLPDDAADTFLVTASVIEGEEPLKGYKAPVRKKKSEPKRDIA